MWTEGSGEDVLGRGGRLGTGGRAAAMEPHEYLGGGCGWGWLRCVIVWSCAALLGPGSALTWV